MTISLIVAYTITALIFAGVTGAAYADERAFDDEESARQWALRFLMSPIWPVLVIRWLADLWKFANHQERDNK